MAYLKLSIDNSILKVLSQERGIKEPPEIEATWSIFPQPIDRFVLGTDIVFYFGSYASVLGPLLTFAVLLTTIAREKDQNLRKGLTVVGVSHTSFWTSWFIVAIGISIL